MLAYRIELSPDDNDTLLITCPDLPLVLSFAETMDDVVAHATDAIETALASMIDDGEDIPPPSDRAKVSQPGIWIRLPLLTTLKVMLYWALQKEGVTRAELARRLGWHREQVDRLFRLDHNSRPDQIDAAFRALNQELDIEMRGAA